MEGNSGLNDSVAAIASTYVVLHGLNLYKETALVEILYYLLAAFLAGKTFVLAAFSVDGGIVIHDVDFR